MGCLIALLEGIYEELMCMIIPEDRLNEKTALLIEVLVKIFSGILIIAIIIGLICLINDEQSVRVFGKVIIKSSLIIIIVQIVLGIVVRIISKHKKKQ